MITDYNYPMSWNWKWTGLKIKVGESIPHKTNQSNWSEAEVDDKKQTRS